MNMTGGRKGGGVRVSIPACPLWLIRNLAGDHSQGRMLQSTMAV